MGWYTWYRANYSTPKAREVPRMDISLADVTMEEIALGAKSTKYYGNTMVLTDGDEVQEFENVEFKGRGNSTWGQIKKPYQIKLEEKADLLGLGRAKKWVLLANYFDASYLRTAVAFEVARMLGDQYAFRGDFVELYVDENYYGLYYLTHKVNISKDEINLHDPLGVVMELDNLHKDGNGLFSEGGDYLVAKDVVSEDREAEAQSAFVAVYSKLEKAVRAGDWTAVQKYADVESFAKYYLLSEFTNNPDAYTSSFFMHWDGADDVIHAGPGWDFDLALANQEWGEEFNDSFYDPEYQWASKDRVYGGAFENKDGDLVDFAPSKTMSKMLFNLMKLPEFEELVAQVWQEKMAGKSGELLGYICEQARYISASAEHDEARWKYDGFEEETEDLINWVERRYFAFEEWYGLMREFER